MMAQDVRKKAAAREAAAFFSVVIAKFWHLCYTISVITAGGKCGILSVNLRFSKLYLPSVYFFG